MKTVGLVAKHEKAEAVVLARSLAQSHPGLTLLAEPHLAQALGWPETSPAELAQRAELVMVLGGDGTLIAAARMLKGKETPILGVNLGSLGFLTEVPQADVGSMLDLVLNGKAQVDARLKLTCRLYRDDRVLVEDEVLNDVVINKGALARIADHETSIDGQFVTLYKSDGVIVSTPTGSTAYSLSAHGPIVHPHVDCTIVTPICPHALTQRPIVVHGDQVIRIRLRSEVADVYLTLDGQSGHTLQQGDCIEVQKSKNRVLLVRNPAMDYFAVLRQKLRWGER